LQQTGIEAPDGSIFRAAIRASEAAKCALTDAESIQIKVQLGGQAVEADLDRATFEALIRPIVERTGEACRQAIEDAELSAAEIDEVVLVGGSTRVPLVRRYVAELFGREPHCDLDPDMVVALGAAMQADILGGKSDLSDEILLVDVVPLSLGIEMMGGVTERIIPRTSAIPSSASQTFTTHVDGQTAVDIHVVQGEREMAADNRSLARFKLGGLPPLPAGIPRVRVDFTVDADGILRVGATEEHTGNTTSVEVTPSYGLTDEEIEDMLEDAIDHAEEDIDIRLLIECRVEGEQILHHISKAMAQDADLMQGDEEASFTVSIAELQAVLGGDDRRKIQEAGRKIDEISAPFAQRRIERDLELALGGRSTDAVARRLGVD
jgi:molecular chaperone HscA